MRSLENAIGRDVPRETLVMIEQFEQRLAEWSRVINLIAPADYPVIRDRHVIDSAQLWPHLPNRSRHLVDIGSGGGFPGLVLAILAKSLGRPLAITLVEADQRKAAFLQTVIATLDLDARVQAQRIESMPALNADVLTARACAPLARLLDWARPHLAPQGRCLFLKGARWQQELTEARRNWHIDLTAVVSRTDSSARLLVIEGFHHAPAG